MKVVGKNGVLVCTTTAKILLKVQLWEKFHFLCSGLYYLLFLFSIPTDSHRGVSGAWPRLEQRPGQRSQQQDGIHWVRSLRQPHCWPSNVDYLVRSLLPGRIDNSQCH